MGIVTEETDFLFSFPRIPTKSASTFSSSLNVRAHFPSFVVAIARFFSCGH
jgi:hypothetical protein